MFVEGVRRGPVAPPFDPQRWPFTMPAVRQLLGDGLGFTAPVCFLVGENGSGKSTVLEAIAEAHGVDTRGGTVGRRYAPSAPRSELARQLTLDLTAPGRRALGGRRGYGYFLRAETAFGYFEYVTEEKVTGYGERGLLEHSHGESFWQLFEHKFRRPGLYFMDEPESALSFSSCLRLLGLLRSLVDVGAQVICATHSPLLTALPGAQILEVGEHGFRPARWDDLQLVDHWRRYLNKPDAYLRHLSDDEL